MAHSHNQGKRSSKWRLHAIQVIQRVIAENPGLEQKQLRKKISDAYPFGERGMWPYQVWLSEVKIQLGFVRRYVPGQKKPAPNQTELF